MTREEGMLDVGKHCHLCNQLDFLPFICSFCHHQFCLEHRNQKAHYCTELNDNIISIDNNNQTITENNEKFFKTLLPEKANIRILNQNNDYNINNSSKKDEKSMKEYLNRSAKERLIRFINSIKSSSGQKAISNSKLRISNIEKLKKNSIGLKSISNDKRLYINCFNVTNSDEDQTSSSNPTPVFVDRTWINGKIIDYLSNQLNVKNKNLSIDTDNDEKLYLYIKKDSKTNNNNNENDNWLLLQNNKKISLSVKNGDELYLVRGIM